MTEPKRYITGRELLKHSKRPEMLRAFLEERPDCIGTGPSSLHKSIIVLKGKLDSNLHVVEKESGSLPMLERTGKFPPSMLVPELGNIVTTDPDEQRIGSDYINLEVAAKHFATRVAKFLTIANASGTIPPMSSDLSTLALAVRGFMQCCSGGGRVVDHLKNYSSWSPGDWFNLLTDLFFRHVRFISQIPILNINFPVLRQRLENVWNNVCDSLPSPVSADEEMAKRALTVLLESAKSSIHLLTHQRKTGKEVKHIVVQGAGDVSMNFWNVAYIGQSDRMIYAPEEKLNERQYSCLVSWKRDALTEKEKLLEQCVAEEQLFRADSLSIGRVRFSRFDTGPNRVRLVTGRDLIAIKDDIQYALYGHRLAWRGEVVEVSKIIGEFSDLRHVFNLVNLNPNREITTQEIKETRKNACEANPDLMEFFSDKLEAAYASKPRYLFGVPHTADVWLGESAFLAKPELAQSACDHPVSMPLSDLGAPLDWITVCMRAWGYNLQKNRDMVSKPGDFAWDVLNPTDPKLVWCPSPAYFPCTMVGIGSLNPSQSEDSSSDKSGNGDLFLLAWGHGFREDQRYNIFECAQILCDLGAKAVLLIDEGRDVFQHYFPTVDDLGAYLSGSKNDDAWSPVPPDREQIRGTLTFWTEEG